MLEIVRVVVVDDSAFMRKMISDMVESRSNYKVVAKFGNGKELIENIDKYNPDIVTLDIEMPVLNGIETLKKLKYSSKKYPVIMLSNQTSKDSIHTIECLELGAIDFIQKPGAMVTDINQIKDELLLKIEATVEEKNKRQLASTNGINYNANNGNRLNKKKTKSTYYNNYSNNGIDAVVIGASTGGPKALQKVLPIIEDNINVPVFVVQHMPKGFTKAFAERMDKLSKLKVVEAQDNMKICKNTIYIAPGGFHMKVYDKDTIKLSTEPPIWGVRPAVDKLFDSAVRVYNGKLLSVVLTGMGRDGADGTVHVKNAGGTTISEDESTCTIYGMPKAAFETGKVDMVLKIDDIGQRITEIVKGR